MRLVITGAIAVLAAGLSACAPYAAPPYATAIDPEQATERAAAGAVLGSAIGAGLGATVSTLPPAGAIAGAEIGGGVGAALGVMTSAPPPTYDPIPVPTQAVIPNFYDNWPPGYHLPPTNTEAQPPRDEI
jgi:hypothetical protein